MFNEDTQTDAFRERFKDLAKAGGEIFGAVVDVAYILPLQTLLGLSCEQGLEHQVPAKFSEFQQVPCFRPQLASLAGACTTTRVRKA
jgi:hypothetical protein